MFEPRILVLAPAVNEAESMLALERVRRVTLPNVTKFVVAFGKLDTQKSSKTFNAEAEAGFPAELAELHTLEVWADGPEPSGPRMRGGFDLFCLRRILEKHGTFDYALLLYEPGSVQDRWNALLADIEGQLFIAFGQLSSRSTGAREFPNVLFNLTHHQANACLDLAWVLHVTGAVYAMPEYRFDGALGLAVETLNLQQELSNRETSLDLVDTNAS